jgi:hypothetical protein
MESEMHYLPDEIKIGLHFTDVQEVDDSLTNDEARQILQLIADAGTSNIDIKAWIKYFYSI